MFRFTGKPSSGSHRQYLGKITYLVQYGYVELVPDVINVMAAYCDLWGVCVQTVTSTTSLCKLLQKLILLQNSFKLCISHNVASLNH